MKWAWMFGLAVLACAEPRAGTTDARVDAGGLPDEIDGGAEPPARDGGVRMDGGPLSSSDAGIDGGEEPDAGPLPLVVTVGGSSVQFNSVSFDFDVPDLDPYAGGMLIDGLDRLAVFDREPDLSTFDGFLRDVVDTWSDAVFATPTGDGFEAFLVDEYLVRNTEVQGSTVFVEGRTLEGTTYLVTIQGGVATRRVAWSPYRFVVDESYLYSVERYDGVTSIVRRLHDGTIDRVLDAYVDGGDFYGRRPEVLGHGGYFVYLPRDTALGESGRIVGYRPDGSRFDVSEPVDFAGAALGAAGDTLYIARDEIHTVALGQSEPTRLVSQTQISDVLGHAAYCGTRYEYGQGGGFDVDDQGLYLLCHSSEHGQAMIHFSLEGDLVTRYDLPSTWATLGPLSRVGNHFCALEQRRWSSSPKHSQLRCWTR